MIDLVSVIILNYNGERFLDKCLESVLKSDYPNFEVVLVDNRSTDGSLELAKRKFSKDKRIKIVENKENLGYAEGNNIGVKHSDGKLLAFLNMDTEVNQDWLLGLVGVIEGNQDVGAVQPKIIQKSNPKMLDSAGFLISSFDGSPLEIRDIAEEKFNEIRPIVAVKGAAFLMRRSIFNTLKGFDETYFMYCEEIDLSLRTWLNGYKVLFVPNSSVYHAGGTGIKSPVLEYHFHKNAIRTYLKNYGKKELLRFLPQYILRRAMQALLQTHKINDCDYFMSFIRALIWNIQNIQNTLYLRKANPVSTRNQLFKICKEHRLITTLRR